MASPLDNRTPEWQTLVKIKAAAELLYSSYSKDSERYRLAKEALADSAPSERQPKEEWLTKLSQVCDEHWRTLQDLVSTIESEWPDLPIALRVVTPSGLTADSGIAWHERHRPDWDAACNDFQQIVKTTEILLSARTPPAPGAKQGEGNGGADAAPGQEQLPPALTQESVLRQLQPAVRKAYLAFQYAETMAEKQLQDHEAHAWLHEHGIDTEKGDVGELADYTLPALGTWSRYVRTARKALDEHKYTPRAGRAGRSIIKASEIEHQHGSDE